MQSTWLIGDKPEAHPLWQDQIDLEMEMTTRGAERFWSRFEDARDPGANPKRQDPRPGSRPAEMTRLRTYHHKMEDMVPHTAAILKAWLADCRRDRRRAAIAFSKLEHVDPYVVAFITLRTIFDRASVAKINLLETAMHIGLEVEYQARMQAWVGHEKDLPKEDRLFGGVQATLRKQKATVHHVRRVNINRFNKLMKEELHWSDWSFTDRQQVGLRMVDVVKQAYPECFDIAQDPMWTPFASQHDRHKSKSRGSKFKPPYVILISDALMDELEEGVNRDAMSCPIYMPTLMPPKRWEGVRGGGYYSPVTRKPTLIRFHTYGEEERSKVLDDYDALEMPRVQAALNYVQETPWRINHKVYDVARRIWEEDLGIAGISKRERKPLPPKPEGMERPDIQDPKARREAEREWANLNPAALATWKRAASEVYGENARRESKATSVRETMRIADRLYNREFYFPHMLDFRGRMYPIPVYLQPQGNDLARGLLTFASGKEVGEDGVAWLAIHLANCFGKDKIPYGDRCDWVEENRDMFVSIATDPLRDRRWITEAAGKSCWQALAATYEWVRYLREGPTMVSSLPIRVDGTCNGIQHLSAMMRDEVGGAQVNLVPDATQRDIYKEVADALKERLLVVEDGLGYEGQMATMWLDAFPRREIGRDFTKRQVMVLPYGATTEAYMKYVWEWLNENDRDKVKIPDDGEKGRGRAVAWIVKHMWSVVNEMLPQPLAAMKWIQDCARVVAEVNQPIIWTTPSGFVVRHFYGTVHARKIESMVDGRRITLQVYDRTAQLSQREQLQGISPNFVHSMDGCANMETLITMALDNERLPMTTIHDAYGTVAGAMWRLFNAIRKAFVWLHERDVLADFRNSCVRMLRDHYLATREGYDWYKAMEHADEMVPQLPERGSLDVTLVRESDYFFA